MRPAGQGKAGRAYDLSGAVPVDPPLAGEVPQGRLDTLGLSRGESCQVAHGDRLLLREQEAEGELPQLDREVVATGGEDRVDIIPAAP